MNMNKDVTRADPARSLVNVKCKSHAGFMNIKVIHDVYNKYNGK